MRRVLFRALYVFLLVAIFLGGAWLAFEKSIVGRSLTVPDLVGKSLPEAIRIAHDTGLQVDEQAARARNDDRIPRNLVLTQSPESGSLAKPSQIVRVVLSLGPRELRVPDLSGLPPRAAAMRLAQDTLQLGALSWYRDPTARIGIVAQDPEPESPLAKNAPVAVLTNRGLPETRYVMPDLIGKDAEVMKSRLEAYGFRVGSARFESYEGVPPNTVLKQFPTAGSPLSSREVVSVTVSRASDAFNLPVSR
ncbi:MAG: PASTA domain-containing protein [Acidobacteria bacterium]|nr:PASTA domain-containing protein [Acidobacteriota bacterium]MCA1611510.1 PASTA domain-containing protein [Acidobacteriota bacterium]